MAIAASVGIAMAVSTNLIGIINTLTAVSFIIMAVCFYQLFKLRCSQIEYERKLNEMVDKTKK